MQGSAVTRSQIIRFGASMLGGGLLASCGASDGPPPAATRTVTLQIDNNWLTPPDRLTIMQAWLARANHVYRTSRRS